MSLQKHVDARKTGEDLLSVGLSVNEYSVHMASKENVIPCGIRHGTPVFCSPIDHRNSRALERPDSRRIGNVFKPKGHVDISTWTRDEYISVLISFNKIRLKVHFGAVSVSILISLPTILRYYIPAIKHCERGRFD